MIRRVLPALLLAGCAASPPGGGGGIVSINPCADVTLVRLLPARRIAAISHYSQEADATSLPLSVARRFRATAGTAEEVIALAPDLVVASRFTPPATRDAFARARLRVLYLDSPQTIAANIAQIRELAAATGSEAAGEALVRQIEAALRDTRATVADRPALFYLSGDLATGGGTLLDEMMRHVGLANAAARYGVTWTGRLPVEAIVADPPAVIVSHDEDHGRTATLRRAVLPGIREARFPRTLVNCGGPAIPAALHRLAAIRGTLA